MNGVRAALAGLMVLSWRELPAQDLRFVATDYAFLGPTVARPGVHRITLVNHGRDVHHLVISAIPDSLRASRLYEMLMKNEPAPADIHDVGGPNATAAGDSTTAIVRLRPGRYMLDCWIRAADGKLHVMKGMFGQLDVRGAPLDVREPVADVVISAREYALSLSRPLRAGSQMIRFENAGTQEHDLQVVRLRPAATSRAAARRLDGDTTGVGYEYVAGVSGVGPGRHAWTRVTLRPGRYAVFCFVPDEKDGKSHYDHGMVREFEIR